MDKLLEKLYTTFDYCDCIVFEPFPSATINFLEGYRVFCTKYNKYIDDINSCCGCEQRIK